MDRRNLSRRTPRSHNEYLPIAENWVAYVDGQDHGLGAYVPEATEATCYRFLGGGGSDCSYVAPITTFALRPGLEFTYEAYLAVGPLDRLREQFTILHRARENPSVRAGPRAAGPTSRPAD